jgi:hypothetical protein
MENKFKLLKYTIQGLCLLSTIICVHRCYCKYQLDLDVSLVEQKRFGEEDRYVKPTISMCFFNPFIPKRFENNDVQINISDYKRFLSGKLWRKNMIDINFEEVTRNLNDYILGYFVQWGNSSYKFYDYDSGVVKKPYLSYVGYYVGWILKCYSVDIPLEATNLQFMLRKDIFPNGTLPPLNWFGVSFHYPGQFLKSYDNMRQSWQTQQSSVASNRGMLLKLNILEVTVRRNTKMQPCNEDWRMDDSKVFQQYIEKGVKCLAPYHPWNLSFTACDTKEKMAHAYFPLGNERDHYMQPCQSAEKIVYEYTDLDLTTASNGDNDNLMTDMGISDVVLDAIHNLETFNIVVMVKSSRFKAIIHKQAYDIEDFIGNSGGYVGLFLGMFKHKLYIDMF